MIKGKNFGVYRFIYLIIIIFIGLQFLNQFLIITGNKIFSLLQTTTGYEVFIVGVFQQSIQMLLAIILAIFLLNKDAAGIGINTLNFKKSIKYFGIFSSIILLIIFLYLFVTYIFFQNLWQDMRNATFPSTTEIALKFLFQSIFPGLGEEFLFRGFLISFLILKMNLNMDKF